ncbi:hypothetical protein FDB53_17175 [Clostridium botulinum]|uniref:hypothetical protein n=1 Tax=Clostridium botulinum TaxID=1491 RepID=UPI000772D7F9|nr:hypothetical protein [Clostridium botulinum]NFN46899.1 hypothetical protein [Clostridium botulinum]
MVNEIVVKLYNSSCNQVEKELKDGVEYNKVCEVIKAMSKLLFHNQRLSITRFVKLSITLIEK